MLVETCSFNVLIDTSDSLISILDRYIFLKQQNISIFFFPDQPIHSTFFLNLAKNNVVVAISSNETIQLLENKIKFSTYISNHYMKDLVPQVFYSLDEIKYPCVFKRYISGSHATHGKGILFFNNRKDIDKENNLQQIDFKTSLIQEAILSFNESNTVIFL